MVTFEGRSASCVHLSDAQEQTLREVGGQVAGKRSATCAHLSDAQETTLREIVGQVAGKWPLWTLQALDQAQEPLRFARLLERVEGISQKMLTQTLRALERDGLVTRTVFAEVPPRVEYALTEVGRETMAQFASFWIWIVGQLPSIEAARRRFDDRSSNK